MNTKSKVFYASQELIPVITESLKLQLEQEFKNVKVENRLNNGTEITISAKEHLALFGGKIKKTIALTPASNGQIISTITGMGIGGILLPCVIAGILCITPFVLFGIVYAIVIYAGIRKKDKVCDSIFDLIKESIEANRNFTAAPKVEKTCPNCGNIAKGAGFCPECGTKII